VPFESLDPSELIWGGRAIARAIGRTEAATFHALERGRVPGARRVGGRWALHVPSFRAAFECMASAAGVAAWPVVARAQQPSVIGYLGSQSVNGGW
jgi:hypothetical protein